MDEGIVAALGVLVALTSLVLGLVLKRLSEIDAKLDSHIATSEDFRADVRVLKDRWERK